MTKLTEKQIRILAFLDILKNMGYSDKEIFDIKKYLIFV